MRHFLLIPIGLCLAIAACKPSAEAPVDIAREATVHDQQTDIRSSVVRINSTVQDWNAWQPWEKNPPSQRRALAAIVGDQQVLTTAELAANATYLEFESADGTRFIPAKVIARDDEANLALLGPTDPQQGEEFFEGTIPLELADPSAIGDTLEIIQLEANGVPLITPGPLQSVDLISGYIPGHYFLGYMVKASMQSAASSYSLPVLNNDKLAGILISYDSKDQICDVSATDIIRSFLERAANPPYIGFPSLGVRVAFTEDTSFRQWLKLADDQGGLYINNVGNGSAAEAAGVQAGDVILAVDGKPLDRRGYYEHPLYGSLLWSHLVRGAKSPGDPLTLRLLRDGKELEVTATLTREEESEKLVPSMLPDEPPHYLVKGGLIFQELTRTILESYGKDWQSRAPLNLLDAYENPEKFEDGRNRVVFLSGVVPTPATIGYERLRNLIVSKVNGRDVKDTHTLIEAFNHPDGGLHSIEFVDEHLVVYLDGKLSSYVDSELLKRGISSLSCTGPGHTAQAE